MKNKIFKGLKFIVCLTLLVLSGYSNVYAEESAKNTLPIQGYYVSGEDNAVSGILFEDNQMKIYINDQSYYGHGRHYHEHTHDHSHGDDHHGDQHGHNHPHKPHKGVELVESLFELNSFPHPDLKNYSPSVQQTYLDSYNLPYDLQEIYQKITDNIKPDMSQLDIIKEMNNCIPGIYYTEKEGFRYFILAAPTVVVDDNELTIELFGEEIMSLTKTENKLVDQDGSEYEHVEGIRPN